MLPHLISCSNVVTQALNRRRKIKEGGCGGGGGTGGSGGKVEAKDGRDHRKVIIETGFVHGSHTQRPVGTVSQPKMWVELNRLKRQSA